MIKILKRIQEHYNKPGLKKAVEDFVTNCPKYVLGKKVKQGL